MSRRALAGGYGPAQKDGSKRPRTTQAPPDPRDFALAVMRDESQPMALRASMAKAALPYAHKRGEEMEAEEKPQQRKYSDLELARRISYILALGKKEEEKLAEEARTGTPAVPALSPPPRGGPPDWENSRAVVHPSVSTPPLLPPSEAGRVPSASEAGGALHAQTPPGRSFHSRPPSPEGEGEKESQPRHKPATPAWPDDDAAQSRDIYPDPHPGYRWI